MSQSQSMEVTVIDIEASTLGLRPNEWPRRVFDAQGTAWRREREEFDDLGRPVGVRYVPEAPDFPAMMVVWND